MVKVHLMPQSCIYLSDSGPTTSRLIISWSGEKWMKTPRKSQWKQGDLPQCFSWRDVRHAPQPESSGFSSPCRHSTESKPLGMELFQQDQHPPYCIVKFKDHYPSTCPRPNTMYIYLPCTGEEIKTERIPGHPITSLPLLESILLWSKIYCNSKPNKL